MRTFFALSLLLLAIPIHADEPKKDDLAANLKELADKPILPKDFDAANMMSRDVRERIRAANLKDLEEWRKIESKEQWEKFRDVRIAALKKSLGEFPEPPNDMRIVITKTIDGDGYKIENTLFESRSNFWVTANVYCPAKPQGKGMPGILIIHAHHNPKEQGELQDMGVMWAKAGCYVVVMDQLGHGERRQHPFDNEKSYSEPFKVGRQDYYFRYNLGIQLSLIGDSLVGWMAWDVMRGVDLLLKKPGIDPEKIILLGSVAGGGDPSAVTAALDPRIKCLVPFNFGGPQPETRVLGADAETAFNYAGGGSWESTRNLRDSARDGFLPWLIVGSVGPRYLIHAHEFKWDKDTDPVWKRYQKIWGFYGAQEKLAYTHGFGTLTGKGADAGSHCNNIGPEHRKLMHVAFEKWFGIKAVEVKDRRPAEDLRCWTETAKKELKPHSMLDLVSWRAKQFLSAGAEKPKEGAAERARESWKTVLGVEPIVNAKKVTESAGQPVANGVQAKSIDLQVERDVRVPALLLLPSEKSSGAKMPPVLVAFSQDGKARLLKDRSAALAQLLGAGFAVCLPDLRGTGESRAGSGRGRTTSATSISSSEQMLGCTVLGEQLRDLSAIINYLRESKLVDGQRVALWGESFAPSNGDANALNVPHDVDRYPKTGDPGAAMLALLAELYHPESVKAVLARGGLLSFDSALKNHFLYIPHDSAPPATLRAWDCHSLYQATAFPTRLEGLIDGQNLRIAKEKVDSLPAAVKILRDRATGNVPFEVAAEMSDDAAVAAWFKKQLAK